MSSDLRASHIRLFRKFAHLYDSGVPIIEALNIVRPELDEPLNHELGGIIDDLYHGVSMADALGSREALFGPEIVGVIRAGEIRGALGDAARKVAEGLVGGVLDPMLASEAAVEQLLEFGALEGCVHLEPTEAGGRLRVRRAGVLEDAGEADLMALAAALASRTGAGGPNAEGVFFWNERLVRYALLPTPHGPAGTLRVSGDPGEEPAEAAKWRAEPPALLVVAAPLREDKDATLRAILRGFDPDTTRRVAVSFPVPEALVVASMQQALLHDADVVCLGRLDETTDGALMRRLLSAGAHVLAPLDVPAADAKEWLKRHGLPAAQIVTA
ncbi:MAG: type II secretion system F family protein [Planctomycetota bacterium]